MKVFVVLALCLAAVSCGPDEDVWLQYNIRMPGAYYTSEPIQRQSISGRIVGGVDAEISEFPYQLSLRRNGIHSCGASVISDMWALSAAHCTFPVPNLATMSLRGGTSNRLSGGIIFNVDRIENHPQYNDWNLENDVCVIRTQVPMQGPFIAPIGMAPTDSYYPAGTRAVVSGWGLTSVPGPLPTILQMVNISLIDADTCKAGWPAGWITPDMLCASDFGYDACSGDSGGPLVAGGRQIGIVSWGSVTCLGGEPGIYARVSYPLLRNWITETTAVE